MCIEVIVCNVSVVFFRHSVCGDINSFQHFDATIWAIGREKSLQIHYSKSFTNQSPSPACIKYNKAD